MEPGRPTPEDERRPHRDLGGPGLPPRDPDPRSRSATQRGRARRLDPIAICGRLLRDHRRLLGTDHPSTLAFLDGHANLLARAQQWERATALFEEAFRFRGYYHDERAAKASSWYPLAVLRLRAGDVAGYRAVCAGSLEHFGRSNNHFGIVGHVARACSLMPDAVADPERPLDLARRSVQRIARQPLVPVGPRGRRAAGQPP